jgi:hypothetical protein
VLGTKAYRVLHAWGVAAPMLAPRHGPFVLSVPSTLLLRRKVSTGFSSHRFDVRLLNSSIGIFQTYDDEPLRGDFSRCAMPGISCVHVHSPPIDEPRCERGKWLLSVGTWLRAVSGRLSFGLSCDAYLRHRGDSGCLLPNAISAISYTSPTGTSVVAAAVILT